MRWHEVCVCRCGWGCTEPPGARGRFADCELRHVGRLRGCDPSARCTAARYGFSHAAVRLSIGAPHGLRRVRRRRVQYAFVRSQRLDSACSTHLSRHRAMSHDAARDSTPTRRCAKPAYLHHGALTMSSVLPQPRTHRVDRCWQFGWWLSKRVLCCALDYK